MPLIYERRIRRVSHIGHLSGQDANLKPSRDGFGIAVSVNPDDWRRIAGLNGPALSLDFPAASWIDILSWEDSDIQELIAWGTHEGYLREVTVWNTTIYSEEDDDFVDRAHPSFEAACAAIGRTPQIEREARERDEGGVEEELVQQLTKLAVRRLGGPDRWPDPLTWYDGIALIYAREVVLRKRPHVVGIWWAEPREVAKGLSAYGVLFPERLHLFNVIDEEGDTRACREAYPDIVEQNPDRLVRHD